jgi:hypothetical protein
VLDNGFVNLVAVVGFLIISISAIPAVLYLGTPKARTSPSEPSEPSEPSGGRE